MDLPFLSPNNYSLSYFPKIEDAMAIQKTDQ